MKIRFDPEADAAFIYFGTDAESVARTEPCDVEFQGASVILMIGASGRLVGLEVLGASKILPASVLDEAQT